jgi:hypothetical protein
MSDLKLYPLPSGWYWTAVPEGESVRLTANQEGGTVDPSFSLSTPPTPRAIYRQSKYIGRKVFERYGAQSEANRLAGLIGVPNPLGLRPGERVINASLEHLNWRSTALSKVARPLIPPPLPTT